MLSLNKNRSKKKCPRLINLKASKRKNIIKRTTRKPKEID
jgi:hypothetical protein